MEVQKINLQEFLSISINAFRNTSFDPEKRGKQYLKESETALNEDLKEIEKATEEEKERYINGFKKHYSNWMNAKSRCFSVMITGAGNFNNSRHKKANNSERNRSDDFYNYRVKATKGILKAIKKRKPQNEVNSENWERLQKIIHRSSVILNDIDTGISKGYSRALFVTSLYNKINTFAKKGDSLLIEKATDLITLLNQDRAKPIFSSRHKFWKLAEQTKDKAEKLKELSEKEDKIHQFEGFQIIFSYKDERIKVIHEQKPERDVINTIKNYGFRWAFKEKVWQRKLTNNGIYNTKLLLKELK